MNRPIKFRVWDKRETKGMSTRNMLYDAQLHHFWQDFVDYPGYELMQYTGLKDSKGNEIYEGDILENPYDVSNNIIGQVLYESDHGGYIFQWKRKVRGQGYKITNLNCDVAFESVIVGNIFEHSELLN